MANADSTLSTEQRELTAALGALHETACYVAEAAEVLLKQWAPELCAEEHPNLFKGLVQTIEKAACKQLDAIEVIENGMGIESVDWKDMRRDSAIFESSGEGFSKASIKPLDSLSQLEH